MSLPNTRPTANTFGPDMEDDSAIVDPDLETPASVWNLMRNALAFCGQVVPLSTTTFSGAGAVLRTRGGVMTVERLGAGDYRCSTSGGWVIQDARATAYSAAIGTYVPTPNHYLESSTAVRIRTYDAAFTPTDQNFFLECW